MLHNHNVHTEHGQTQGESPEKSGILAQAPPCRHAWSAEVCCYCTAGGSKIRTEIPGEYAEHCTGDTGHVTRVVGPMWNVASVHCTRTRDWRVAPNCEL